MDQEQEVVVDPDHDLPKFKSRFSDLPIEKIKLLVRSPILIRKPRVHHSLAQKSLRIPRKECLYKAGGLPEGGEEGVRRGRRGVADNNRQESGGMPDLRAAHADLLRPPRLQQVSLDLQVRRLNFQTFVILFMNFVSEAVWKGSSSNRFEGGRIHFPPQDELTRPTVLEPPVGKRHFDPKESAQIVTKPSIRPFPNTYQQTTTEIRISQKKNFDFKPSQKHPRRERLHVRQGVSGHQEDLKVGILCQGKITKNSQKEHFVEQQMNRKKKLEHYDLTRNQIDVAALGDKPYKYPQQAPGFFHQEGIVVGSTIRPRKPKGFVSTISTSTASGRLTYKQKVRIEQQELQEKQVVQLDNWIEHTLKQANPNYRDPELLLEQQQNAKKEAGKKGTKK